MLSPQITNLIFSICLRCSTPVETSNLKKLSETALKQIKEKKYDTELIAASVNTIYKYGVAFCGKNVEVTVG